MPSNKHSKRTDSNGLCHRNNSYEMAGNISCIKVNLGDTNEDGVIVI